MLITPPSLRLDYALPACCQARLLGGNHWELRAGAEQTRQRRNQTINQQIVTLRPWPGCVNAQYATESGNLCYMHIDISCECNWVRFSSFLPFLIYSPFWPTSITVRSIQIFALFSFFTFRNGAGSRQLLPCPSVSSSFTLSVPATLYQTRLEDLPH